MQMEPWQLPMKNNENALLRVIPTVALKYILKVYWAFYLAFYVTLDLVFHLESCLKCV